MYSDNDDDCGCYHCGAICFVYAKGSSSLCEACDLDMDIEIETAGGIDKCMNCGKYKTGNQLNEHQVCIRGCKNPNEY